jgi:CRISPR/Cas system-associated protein endoribonuclease Cas2
MPGRSWKSRAMSSRSLISPSGQKPIVAGRQDSDNFSKTVLMLQLSVYARVCRGEDGSGQDVQRVTKKLAA